MKTTILILSVILFGFGAMSTAQAASVSTLVISEVFYDRDGADDQYEWIELFNGTTSAIDLDEWSIGTGGDDYAEKTIQLGGTIAPNTYFVLGGPTSDDSNGNPLFSLSFDLPSLQNSGNTADGVALFNIPASSITAATVPFFSVIYGGSNDSGLMDPTGAIGAVDVGDAPEGQSIEFLGSAEGWAINPSPTPGSGPLATVPVPAALWLFGSGLIGIVGLKRGARV